jgi:hypothetical protein
VEQARAGSDGSCAPSLKDQCDQVGVVFPMCLENRCCGPSAPAGCELCSDVLRRCEPCLRSPCRLTAASEERSAPSQTNQFPSESTATAVGPAFLPGKRPAGFGLQDDSAGGVRDAAGTRRVTDVENPELSLAVASGNKGAPRSSPSALPAPDPLPRSSGAQAKPQGDSTTESRSPALPHNTAACEEPSTSFVARLTGQCTRQRE